MNVGELRHAYRAVLFIDVVNSVRLIERDEEGTILRWLRIVDRIEIPFCLDQRSRRHIL